jgi:hypothetical protein
MSAMTIPLAAVIDATITPSDKPMPEPVGPGSS